MNQSIVTMFDKDHTKFILCDCKNEVLVIDYNRDLKTADLAIYESFPSYCHKNGWKQKLKYIYRVLTNQYPYSDQIILNRNQLKDLSKFLNEILL